MPFMFNFITFRGTKHCRVAWQANNFKERLRFSGHVSATFPGILAGINNHYCVFIHLRSVVTFKSFP